MKRRVHECRPYDESKPDDEPPIVRKYVVRGNMAHVTEAYGRMCFGNFATAFPEGCLLVDALMGVFFTKDCVFDTLEEAKEAAIAIRQRRIAMVEKQLASLKSDTTYLTKIPVIGHIYQFKIQADSARRSAIAKKAAKRKTKD